MKNILSLDTAYVDQYLGDKVFMPTFSLEEAHIQLQNRTCKGADFTGWIDYPTDVPDAFITELEQFGKELRENYDAMIVCGIGGSYLGSRAIIEFMHLCSWGINAHCRVGGGCPDIVFLGNHLSNLEYEKVFSKYRGKKVVACIISKSGTTLETAISYRLVREFFLSQYSTEEVQQRIIVVTDEKNGALRAEANRQGYRSFVHPADIGGRYAVFTTVGMVPCAFAGIDIRQLIEGAKKAEQEIKNLKDITQNPQSSSSTSSESDSSFKKELSQSHPALVYADKRVQLELSGFVSELFVAYEPSLYFLGEWFEQLIGESNGKEGKGLYPGSLTFTTDLHSLGQYVQEGRRLFFETVVWIETPSYTITIPSVAGLQDGLETLVGKDLHEINAIAMESTAKAHFDGGCPSLIFRLHDLGAESIGYLLYTLMYACALSGIMMGTNPFDQPGVEAYKKEMRKRF